MMPKRTRENEVEEGTRERRKCHKKRVRGKRGGRWKMVW